MKIPSTCIQCGKETFKQKNAKYCAECVKKRIKESMQKAHKKYWKKKTQIMQIA